METQVRRSSKSVALLSALMMMLEDAWRKVLWFQHGRTEQLACCGSQRFAIRRADWAMGETVYYSSSTARNAGCNRTKCVLLNHFLTCLRVPFSRDLQLSSHSKLTHFPTIMAARPPTVKRTTTTATSIPATHPPCTIHPTAVIADKTLIFGTFPVHIAEHAVLHPYARIRAEGGSVTIGPYCTIAESAIIGSPANQEGNVVLDGWVSVESGAEVLANHVGEVTEVGIKAKINAGATVGRFCRLTPTETVQVGEQVQDFTVLFGNEQRRTDKTLLDSEDLRGQRIKAQEKHVEVLKRLIPDGKAKWLD